MSVKMSRLTVSAFTALALATGLTVTACGASGTTTRACAASFTDSSFTLVLPAKSTGGTSSGSSGGKLTKPAPKTSAKPPVFTKPTTRPITGGTTGTTTNSGPTSLPTTGTGSRPTTGTTYGTTGTSTGGYPSSRPTATRSTTSLVPLILSSRTVHNPGETSYTPALNTVMPPSADILAAQRSVQGRFFRSSTSTTYTSPWHHTYRYQPTSYFTSSVYQDLFNPFDPRNYLSMGMTTSVSHYSPFYRMSLMYRGC